VCCFIENKQDNKELGIRQLTHPLQHFSFLFEALMYGQLGRNGSHFKEALKYRKYKYSD
jgi:hypothetical protein